MSSDEAQISSGPISDSEFDVFVSHASEDKAEVARPLVESLQDAGLKVWFDEQTLTLGDSLQERINAGLTNCRYGVVIFSPNFFAKEWPRRELEALGNREEFQKKVILPIWHKISAEEVTRSSLTLGGRLAVSTDEGLDRVIEAIMRVVRPGWRLEMLRCPFALQLPWLLHACPVGRS